MRSQPCWLALPDVLLVKTIAALQPELWDVDERRAIQHDQDLWLAWYRLLATLQATCRTLRDLVRSPAAEGLWTELCLGSLPQLGVQETQLRAYIEGNASRASRVSMFGDQLPPEHVCRALAACTRLCSLHVYDVHSSAYVDDITATLVRSGAQPTEAGVHRCALGAQLPHSVTELRLSPRWHVQNDADEGWGWYMHGLAIEGTPALAGWVLHR